MGQEGSKGGSAGAPGGGKPPPQRHSALFMDSSVFDSPAQASPVKPRPKSQGDMPRPVEHSSSDITSETSSVRGTDLQNRGVKAVNPADERPLTPANRSGAEAVSDHLAKMDGEPTVPTPVARKGGSNSAVQESRDKPNETTSSEDEFLDAESGGDSDGEHVSKDTGKLSADHEKSGFIGGKSDAVIVVNSNNTEKSTEKFEHSSPKEENGSKCGDRDTSNIIGGSEKSDAGKNNNDIEKSSKEPEITGSRKENCNSENKMGSKEDALGPGMTGSGEVKSDEASQEVVKDIEKPAGQPLKAELAEQPLKADLGSKKYGANLDNIEKNNTEKVDEDTQKPDTGSETESVGGKSYEKLNKGMKPNENGAKDSVKSRLVEELPVKISGENERDTNKLAEEHMKPDVSEDKSDRDAEKVCDNQRVGKDPEGPEKRLELIEENSVSSWKEKSSRDLPEVREEKSTSIEKTEKLLGERVACSSGEETTISVFTSGEIAEHEMAKESDNLSKLKPQEKQFDGTPEDFIHTSVMSEDTAKDKVSADQPEEDNSTLVLPDSVKEILADEKLAQVINQKESSQNLSAEEQFFPASKVEDGDSSVYDAARSNKKPSGDGESDIDKEDVSERIETTTSKVHEVTTGITSETTIGIASETVTSTGSETVPVCQSEKALNYIKEVKESAPAADEPEEDQQDKTAEAEETFSVGSVQVQNDNKEMVTPSAVKEVSVSENKVTSLLNKSDTSTSGGKGNSGSDKLNEMPGHATYSEETRTKAESENQKDMVSKKQDLDDIPLPKGSYNLNFDKIDLDSFNPFATKSKVSLSPKEGEGSGPAKFDFSKDDQTAEETNKAESAQEVTFQTPKPATPPVAEVAPYEAVRELDEQENWRERAAVITIAEHQDNMALAQDTVQAIVDNLPITEQPAASERMTAEDSDNTPASGGGDAASTVVEQVPAPDQPSKEMDQPQSAEKQDVEPEAPPDAGDGIGSSASEPAAAATPVVMEKDTKAESPLPLPKGTYNFNFDDLDSIDPFKSKSKLGMDSPLPAAQNFEDIDPFKPSKKLANSPPPSPKHSDGTEKPPVSDVSNASQPVSDTVDTGPVDSGPCKEPEPVQNNNEGETPKPAKEDKQDTTSKKSPKKKPGLKKGGIKRAKIPRGPPPGWANQKVDDDIQIFMPEKDTEKPQEEPSISVDDTAVTESTDSNHERSSTESTTDSSAAANSTTAVVSDGTGPEEVPTSQAVGSDQALLEELEDPTQFRSGTEVFNESAWNMLEKCGSDMSKESQLARESLYVKFDPLVKGSHKAAIAQVSALPKSKLDQISTSHGADLLGMSTPPRTTRGGGSELSSLQEEVDNLLSCTPQNTNPECDQTEEVQPKLVMVEEDKDELEAKLKLIQQQLELNMLADFAAQKKELQREYEEKLAAMEAQMQQKNEEMQRLQGSHKEMEKLLVEYEKTMNQVIDFTQVDWQERDNQTNSSQQSMADLIQERDQAIEDLHSVETAFSDLHKRYEKLKTTVQGYKKNEDTLKQSYAELQAKLKREVDKYHKLRQHAEAKLDEANEEIDKVRKQHEAEKVLLQAQNKKNELRCESLEQQLEQKVKENKELTNICDSLISKVGK